MICRNKTTLLIRKKEKNPQLKSCEVIGLLETYQISEKIKIIISFALPILLVISLAKHVIKGGMYFSSFMEREAGQNQTQSYYLIL